MLPSAAVLEPDLDTNADTPTTDPMIRWHPATRIAFRFCFIYISLYVLTTQMITGLLLLPVGNVPNIGELPPLRNVTTWVAVHLFGATLPLVISTSGSGDKMFDWVQAFCLLALAAVATAVWSWLDRRRDNYVAAPASGSGCSCASRWARRCQLRDA